MTACFGGKAAVISDCRVILYRDPVMLVVACPLGACWDVLSTCLVDLSSSVETSLACLSKCLLQGDRYRLLLYLAMVIMHTDCGIVQLV